MKIKKNKSDNHFPTIILGGGGHARVLMDALLLQSIPVLGIAVADPALKNTMISGIKVIGTDEDVLSHSPEQVRLVNGLGSVDLTKKRQQLFKKFKKLGYIFTNVIHPSAIIASNVQLSEGVQLMAGSIVQTGSCIGENTIVNTRVSVDHDCKIGTHVHLAPGVILSGEVTIGNGTHVGTGTKVIQGIRIGNNSLVGAGSVIIREVDDNMCVAGSPPRSINSHSHKPND